MGVFYNLEIFFIQNELKLSTTSRRWFSTSRRFNVAMSQRHDKNEKTNSPECRDVGPQCSNVRKLNSLERRDVGSQCRDVILKDFF